MIEVLDAPFRPIVAFPKAAFKKIFAWREERKRASEARKAKKALKKKEEQEKKKSLEDLRKKREEETKHMDPKKGINFYRTYDEGAVKFPNFYCAPKLTMKEVCVLATKNGRKDDEAIRAIGLIIDGRAEWMPMEMTVKEYKKYMLRMYLEVCWIFLWAKCHN